jgi:hypothetical protein
MFIPMQNWLILTSLTSTSSMTLLKYNRRLLNFFFFFGYIEGPLTILSSNYLLPEQLKSIERFLMLQKEKNNHVKLIFSSH